MAAPHFPLATVEEYLEFDRNSEFKNEYYRGQIIAMAGGKPTHAKIGATVTALLWIATEGRSCDVYSSDARLAADRESHYVYPDIMVVYGEPEYADSRQETLANPILVVEVLSPSTESADRGRKFASYRNLESLQEYLMVSQFEPKVELHRKGPDGNWTRHEWTGLDAVAVLESVDAQLPLPRVYAKIEFEPETN